jgi:HAD superfamily hydrolase (TIGR01509 family)
MAPGTAVGEPPRWEEIDTVLLDMDGTLLDRHFDDHFWLEHVPRVYADRRGIGLERSKEELFERFRAQEGTLNWTDLDYWSRELDLDIPELKRQVEHLIAVHPTVTAFLDRLRSTGRAVRLVTNAHGKTLDLKMEKTALAGKFDGIHTSQEIGAPKEDHLFWERLQGIVGFDPSRTLLADDTEAVLERAASFGIRWLVCVARFSSTSPPRPSRRFFSIEWFREIMPPG